MIAKRAMSLMEIGENYLKGKLLKLYKTYYSSQEEYQRL